MRIISIILLSLITNKAIAQSTSSSAKLTWCHDGSAVGGGKVEITGFNLYWWRDGEPMDTNVVHYGNGYFMPDPWKVELNGMAWWTQTITRTDWLPGQRVCFRMTALSFDEESARTNQVCKTFSEDPSAPNIININQ